MVVLHYILHVLEKQQEDTLSIVRLLLEHHANPNVVCNGQTPLSLGYRCPWK